MYQCWRCQRPLPIAEHVGGYQCGRQDLCEGCHSPLHSCRNCKDWDTSAHNQCRESQAEYVADRENGNFCAFFKLRPVRASGEDASASARQALEAAFGGETARTPQHADDAKSRLHDLFGTKPAPDNPAPVDPRKRLEDLFGK